MPASALHRLGKIPTRWSRRASPPARETMPSKSAFGRGKTNRQCSFHELEFTMNHRHACLGLWATIAFGFIGIGEPSAVAQGKAGAKLKFEIYKDKASEFRWRLVG